MTEITDGNKNKRKRLTPKDRRKVLDIHIEEPGLSAREIAARARMRPSTVYRVLWMFKAGKIDRDGFLYENPLCL
jgi:Fe2+ or Zn2+ uptake regulation protein